MRLFYQYPNSHYEFCQDVLTKTASKYLPFTLELRNLVLLKKRNGTSFIRWKVVRPEQLMSLYNEVRSLFVPIIEEIGREMEIGSTTLGQKSFTAKPNTSTCWTFASLTPSIGIANFPTVKYGKKALKELNSEFGNRFWTLRATGLHLGFSPRDSASIPDFQEFPFHGSD
jgi:hypothetical protein